MLPYIIPFIGVYVSISHPVLDPTVIGFSSPRSVIRLPCMMHVAGAYPKYSKSLKPKVGVFFKVLLVIWLFFKNLLDSN